MTNEKTRQNWQRFAKAAIDLLDHPETTPKLAEGITGFLDDMLATEATSEHYRRRLEAMPDLIALDGAESRPSDRHIDERYGDFCLDFGGAISDLLADEQTPGAVWSAVSAFNARMDEWAGKVDDAARRQAYARMLLPSLLEIANDDAERDDEPADTAAAATA